jgi:hypothetical protein
MAAGGAIAGLVVAQNIGRLTRGVAEAREKWPALGVRGFRVEDEKVSGLSAPITPERPVARATIDGVEVEIRIVSDMVHNAHTEVSATGATSEAVAGAVPSPGGIFGYLRSMIGQDIEIGDAAFDDAFIITGKPESAAKTLLTTEVRDRLVALTGGKLAGFRCEKGRAVVMLNGVETELASLEHAIRVAVLGATAKL